jgi:hypothetical protein
MKVLFFLFSVCFVNYAFSQIVISGDIRGVFCDGGFGLCGSVDVSSLSLKANESTYSEFHLIVSEDHVTPIDFNSIGEEEVFFDLQEDVTMDDESIFANNLNPNKKIVKHGLYPVTFQEGQIKVKFILI